MILTYMTTFLPRHANTHLPDIFSVLHDSKYQKEIDLTTKRHKKSEGIESIPSLREMNL